VKHCKRRQKLTPGERNVVHDPLVDAAKVFLPPLHVKRGLVKNFVKAMKKKYYLKISLPLYSTFYFVHTHLFRRGIIFLVNVIQ
jgi:hypothetical protein